MRGHGLGTFGVFAFAFTAVTGAMAGPQMVESKASKNVELQETAACDPRWYISIGGGGDFNIGSTRINDAERTGTNAIALFTVPGGFVAGFGTANIKAHDFDQVYDAGYHVEGEVGYSLTQHLDVFARLRYAHADATDRTRGSTFDVFLFNPFGTTTVPISSEFDDYNSFGGELGFRLYFTPRKAQFRPYLAISGGANHVDAIGIRTFGDFTGFGGPADQEVYRGPFLDDSIVGTASAALGFEVNIGCHFTIGLNGGVRYESKMSDDDSGLNTRGFTFNGVNVTNFSFANQTNNNSGDRLSAPVTGYLKFRF